MGIEKQFFEKALEDIKLFRSAKAARPEEKDLRLCDVKKLSVVGIGDNNLERYSELANVVNHLSVQCIAHILSEYFHEKNVTHRVDFKLNTEIPLITPFLFAITDLDSRTLYVFKEVEHDSLFVAKDSYLKQKELVSQIGIDDIKLIYLVKDYAYLQIINHNEDETDPGRGHNIYSLKWFISQHFGSDTWNTFEKENDAFLKGVREYIGYYCIKALTPRANVDFKKVVENILLTFPYRKLLPETLPSKFPAEMKEVDYRIIESRFKKSLYTVMLSNSDYAESLITAEWLYSSMKTAKAIDLTTIAISYFKAVEQLLFALI